MDKNQNGIKDVIESYILIVVGVLLIGAGVVMLFLDLTTSYKLIYLGIALLLGREAIKKFIGG